MVTVVDGCPSTLAWFGGVKGHRAHALGVERFGRTGTIADLYVEYGVDANAIIKVAELLTGGKRVRRRKASA